MAWGYLPDTGIKGRIYKLIGHPHPVGRLRAKVVLKYLERMKTIDVGCGEGVFVIELSRRGLDVTGVDNHKESLVNAKKKSEIAGVRPKLILANAEKIPVKKNSYGQAICLDVIEHVTYPGKVLKEIFRVLKPGGTLILTVPNILYLKNSVIPYDFEKHLEKIGHLRYGYFYEDLQKLLEKNGFKTILHEYYYKFFSRIAIEFLYILIRSDKISESRESMYRHSLKSLVAFLIVYSFMHLDSILPKNSKGGFVLVKAVRK